MSKAIENLERMQARVNDFKAILSFLNTLEEIGVTGKPKKASLDMMYNTLRGWTVAKAKPDGEIDPVYYIAMLRGGDVRESLKKSIDSLSKAIESENAVATA